MLIEKLPPYYTVQTGFADFNHSSTTVYLEITRSGTKDWKISYKPIEEMYKAMHLGCTFVNEDFNKCVEIVYNYLIDQKII